MFHRLTQPKTIIFTPLVLLMMFAIACGSSAEPVVVEKEVVKEIVKEVVVETEVIKEVPVDVLVEKEVIKEVVKEVMVVATPAPALMDNTPPAERLEKIAISVGGSAWDSNYSYKVNISGFLDKRPVLEWLVGVDRNTGEYIPELATSWQMDPNGKDWTFNLREDVQWQDGYGEFTAEDVRHSLWLLVQPTAKPSGVSTWRKIMGVKKKAPEEVVTERAEAVAEIIDDHTVTIHLGVVIPEALFNLGYRRNLPIESKARWDAVGDKGMGEKMVGTGPFKFSERVEGSHVKYEATDEHWRVVPQYKQLEFRSIEESSTRMAALLTEQVHMAVIERAVQDQVTKRGMKMISGSTPGIQHFWSFYGNYHTEPETLDSSNPMLNQKVRQAMSKAVNRKAIAEAFLEGATVEMPMNVMFTDLDEQVWPGVINPEWNQRWDENYGYDPVKAKELLKDAGYADGFEFTLALTPNEAFPETVDIAQAIAMDFEAVGLKPQILPMEGSEIRSMRRARTIHNTLTSSSTYSYTAYKLETYFCTCGSVHLFQLPELDALFEQVNQTVEKKERTRLFREIGDICFREVCTLPMFNVAPEIAVNSKFIKDYVYPGFISGYYTHLEFLETMPQ